MNDFNKKYGITVYAIVDYCYYFSDLFQILIFSHEYTPVLFAKSLVIRNMPMHVGYAAKRVIKKSYSNHCFVAMTKSNTA